MVFFSKSVMLKYLQYPGFFCINRKKQKIITALAPAGFNYDQYNGHYFPIH